MELKSKLTGKVNSLKIFEVQRKFLSEAIIFSLLQYAISFPNGKSISWTLLAILFLVSFATLLFSNGHIERFTSAYYCSAIPIIIVGTWLSHLVFFEGILLFLFSFWRLKVLYTEDGYEDADEFLSRRLLATILIFVSMYFIGYITGGKTRYLLILFPLLQLLLYSYGTFFKRYVESTHPPKKAFFSFGVLLFIIPIIITTVVSSIASLIKGGLSFVINKIFLLLVNLLSPVINLLISYFDKGNAKWEKRLQDVSEKLAERGVPEDKQGEILQKVQTDHYNMYIVLGIIIVASIIIWIILHRYKIKLNSVEERNEQPRRISSKILEEVGRKEENYTNYYSKSRQQIRKYVLDLERLSKKLHVERHGSESVRNWLNRLDIQATEKWISIYEHVRYGSINASHQDVQYFGAEWNEIKNQIIKIHQK
ncbi:hypothetical protein [Bacillus sp. FJAT-49736]|uniref:hypothetical protein n=1 Tax=Bacillus sp. FJAT-49736 TaxID=2833582 RepID=UPI001BCA6686|nr:hypothetical protein [Bacillus sp. FJAT-49736]MBS4172309.1 hypothetical protein [Bacillus sp. FJAT-49736]